MTDIPSDALEHEPSPFLGLYVAFLMEAAAVALAYVGFRLGELALVWAGALS